MHLISHSLQLHSTITRVRRLAPGLKKQQERKLLDTSSLAAVLVSLLMRRLSTTLMTLAHTRDARGIILVAIETSNLMARSAGNGSPMEMNLLKGRR
jgi:hypothetical protein